MRSTTLLIVASLLATPAYADQCTKASAVTAPCEGVLVPTSWAMECAECRQVSVPLCNAQKDQLAAQLRLARFDLDQARLATYRQWYEHPVLWFSVGVLTAGGAAYLLR